MRTDNRQWTDDGACLYYKLTDEPEGSGELKIRLIQSISNFFQVKMCLT